MTEFHSVLDNAITTLDGGIDDDDLVINVIDGSKFPLTVDCPLILTIEANTANMEKVLITANAANVLTVDASGRGYEGSVAKSHASGVKIELLYVATNITELQTAVNALENGVVNKADFNAQTILAATTDDTPAALTVAEQTLVGRITAGNIAALTPAQVMALLSGQAAATFSMNTQKISGVVDPTADQEAATKKYVDDQVTEFANPVYTWVIANPVVGIILGPRLKTALTCVRLDSYVAAATSVTFNIEERATIGSTGTDILAADQVADVDGETTASFDNASLAADNWLVVAISAVSGSPTQVVVTLACEVT